VDIKDALIPFVAHKQYPLRKAYAALFEKLKIMYAAFGFVNTNDFAGLAIYDDLVFYRMAFSLAGIGITLFFWGVPFLALCNLR
jgi:hypothetical protein